MTEYLGEILNENDGYVVIASNSKSTNAKEVEQKIQQAVKDFSADPNLRGRLKVLPKRENFSHTIEDIKETVRPGDIRVYCFGDGGNSGANQAIMGHPDIEVRNSPVLFLPGGNANLGSNDILKKQGDRISILEILARGKTIPLHPISMNLVNPLWDMPQEEFALFISGVGITAMAENELEKNRSNILRKNRLSRHIPDAYSLISGALKQNKEPIRFIVNGIEYEEGAGILTANVNKYAKVLNTPTSAENPGFSSIILPKANLINQFITLSKALLEQSVWLETPANESLEIEVFSKPGQLIQYDIDAETRSLPFDQSEEIRSTIVQKVHDKPINVISL